MGWYYGRREKGMSDLDYFTRYEGLPKERILAHGSTMKAFYFAWRADDGSVIAGVYLKNWAKEDYYNFGYKPLDEAMGPAEFDCPAKVLDALSDPAPNEWAEQWRAKARARLAQRAKARAVKKGTLVRFEEPLRFTNDEVHSVFTFEGGSKFRSGYGRYHIRSWRDRAFEVLDAV